jgi:hypothetical protein
MYLNFLLCIYQDFWPTEGGELDSGEAGPARGSFHGIDTPQEGLHVLVAVLLSLSTTRESI